MLPYKVHNSKAQNALLFAHAIKWSIVGYVFGCMHTLSGRIKTEVYIGLKSARNYTLIPA